VTDTTPPTLVCPGTVTVEATGQGGATVTLGGETASDLVTPAPAVEYSPASGSTFTVGTHVVEVTATDEAGNTSTCEFQVVVTDTTPPALTPCPDDFTVAATSLTGAAVSWTVPTAVDLVDGALTVTCTPAVGSAFPIGETVVVCEASDASGNAVECSFTVTVTFDAGSLADDVARDLAALLPTGSGATDDALENAIEHLEQGRNPDYWVDATHLTEDGKKAFDAIEQAVRELLRVKSPPSAVVTALGELLEIARVLAQTAYDEAVSRGATAKDLKQALSFLAKATEAVSDGKLDKAVAAYAKAWEFAFKA
jgi:hypothetical protein